MSRFNSAPKTSKLVGSYKLTPTYWAKAQITIDTGTNTLSITGHTLVIGDKVVFTYQTGRSSDFSATVYAGRFFYVRSVSGNTFKLSTDNTDTNIITLPSSLGSTIEWRLEKVTDVISVTISNLNIQNMARVVIRNGGYNSTFPVIQYSFNGVEDSNAYYYVHGSGSGLGTKMYLYHAGSNYPIRLRCITDFICQGNMILGVGEFSFDGASNSTGGNVANISTGSMGESKVDSRFNMINSITINTGSGSFIGDLTIEVYEL